MKWILWLIVGLSTIISSPVLAQNAAPTASVQSYLFGTGRMSCAKWLSHPEYERDGDQWILGYWSGVNVLNPDNHLVGMNSDAEAIFGEVKKICRAEPSTTVNDATARIYYKFQQDGK